MFRAIAPAGMPIDLGNIAKIARVRLQNRDYKIEFGDIIKDYSEAQYCIFINSGRAANYIILKTLKELNPGDKTEIVIPAYTCFSVPASIVRAGLKIRLVDINPETLDYDYQALSEIDYSKVLAILSCNLFGIVSDWSILRRIAKANNMLLVDDSAQTMGLPYDGQKSGTLGDIGFYSFGRGKNMTIYSGGVILTNNGDIASRIESALKSLPKAGMIDELKLFVQLSIYTLMLRPSLYWIPKNLPFLGLGNTLYNEHFSLKQISKLQLCAGPILFSNLTRVNEIRIRNSNALSESISSMQCFKIPGWVKGSKIPFIRLPVLATDQHMRDKAIKMLRSFGISSSTMYPSSIDKIPNIVAHLVSTDQDYRGADDVVKRLFTLPTHPYLQDRDIENIIACLSEISK